MSNNDNRPNRVAELLNKEFGEFAANSIDLSDSISRVHGKQYALQAAIVSDLLGDTGKLFALFDEKVPYAIKDVMAQKMATKLNDLMVVMTGYEAGSPEFKVFADWVELLSERRDAMEKRTADSLNSILKDRS